MDELIGKTFNYWTVESFDYQTRSVTKYICKCKCGTEKSMNIQNVKHGKSMSCGCYHKENQARLMEENIKKEVGNKYGRLTIIEKSNKKSKKAHVRCLCDCGNYYEQHLIHIKNGNSSSCGCLGIESRIKHGFANHSSYNVWRGMMNRCYNKNVDNYKHYGGKGIKVCESWHEIENFIEDMGERPTIEYSLDRIDSSKDYSIENCRWANWNIQNQNKDFSFNGETPLYNITKSCNKYYISVSRERVRRFTSTKSKQDAVKIRDIWIKEYREDPKKWIEKTKNESYK